MNKSGMHPTRFEPFYCELMEMLQISKGSMAPGKLGPFSVLARHELMCLFDALPMKFDALHARFSAI